MYLLKLKNFKSKNIYLILKFYLFIKKKNKININNFSEKY